MITELWYAHLRAALSSNWQPWTKLALAAASHPAPQPLLQQLGKLQKYDGGNQPAGFTLPLQSPVYALTSSYMQRVQSALQRFQKRRLALQFH